MQVSVAEAKDKLPELIRAVEAGERVTVCRRGMPIVDLVRTKTGKGRAPRLGTLKGRIKVNDPNWWKPMSNRDVEAFLEGRY